MKIAVLHNYMDNIGGAEFVGLTLAKELKADLYSTNINYDKINSMGFSNINIKSIGGIPINAPFRQQLALYKFRKLIKIGGKNGRKSGIKKLAERSWKNSFERE